MRASGLDSLRGIAILAMMAYHFGFDLAHYKLISASPNQDLVWVIARTLILASFLLLSGMSFALAESRSRTEPKFWRRLLQIAGCALAVTAGSYLMFPNSPILFGVLHAVCVMWIITRYAGLVRLSAWALALIGVVIGIAHFEWRFEALNPTPLNWIGMVERKPRTEDYVPLVPWFAFFFFGLALGKTRALAWCMDQPWQASWLSALGRFSLSAYMVHQPILIGLILIYLKL